MHLFILYDIIKATSPMSLIASLVASSNLFCIILYLSIVVLFAGNKSTTTTTHAYIGDWEDSEYTQIRLLNQSEFLDICIRGVTIQWFK